MVKAIASAGIGDHTPVESKGSPTSEGAFDFLCTLDTFMERELAAIEEALCIFDTFMIDPDFGASIQRELAAIEEAQISWGDWRDYEKNDPYASGEGKIPRNDWGNYGIPYASGEGKISRGDSGYAKSDLLGYAKSDLLGYAKNNPLGYAKNDLYTSGETKFRGDWVYAKIDPLGYAKNDPYTSGKTKIPWGDWDNYGKNDPYASKSAQLKDKFTRSALILWETNYDNFPHFDGEIDFYTKYDKLDNSPVKPTSKVYPLSSYKLGIHFAKSVADAFSWGQEKICKNIWDYPSVSSYELDIGLVKSINKAAAWIEGGIDAIDNIVSLFHGAYKEGSAIVGGKAIASKDPILSYIGTNGTVWSQLLAAISIGGDLVTKGINNWVGVKTSPHEGLTFLYSEIKA